MQEVIVTRKYQITIPKSIREKLGIRIGDKLLVEVDGTKIVIRPINYREALEDLATIADRILGGSKKIDVVNLVEESLEKETGIH
ncbi:MAG: AbrB/MazE/SpoVT family DNA-binding domain-containing protein [Candidatus Njordarchaeota archaeon]